MWIGVGILAGYWAASNVHKSQRAVRRSDQGEFRNGIGHHRRRHGSVVHLFGAVGQRSHKQAGAVARIRAKSEQLVGAYTTASVLTLYLVGIIFGDFFSDLVGYLGDFLTDPIDALSDAFTDLYNFLDEAIDAIQNVLAQVGSYADQAFDIIAGIISGAGQWWETLLGNLFDWAVNLIETWGETFIETVSGWATALWDTIFP